MPHWFAGVLPEYSRMWTKEIPVHNLFEFSKSLCQGYMPEIIRESWSICEASKTKDIKFRLIRTKLKLGI